VGGWMAPQRGGWEQGTKSNGPYRTFAGSNI
jgi:hypothetical protein